MNAIAPALEQLGHTAASVALAVLPLVLLFLLFQVLFLQLPVKQVARGLSGTLVASAGLFLFLLGVNIAFLPFGRAVGEALGALREPWLLVSFGLLLGFATTWGEPAVRILAEQVEEASAGSPPGRSPTPSCWRLHLAHPPRWAGRIRWCTGSAWSR